MSNRIHPVPLILIATFTTALALGQESPPASDAKPTAKYPDTADGLKKLGEDLYALAKAGDKDKLTAAARDLLLPDPSAWATKTFSDAVANRVADELAMMSKNPDDFAAEIAKLFADRAEKGQGEITVYRLEKAEDEHATGAQKRVLSAMKTPTALYTLNMKAPGDEAGFSVWSFVYADNGFRLVGKLKSIRE